MSTSTTSSLDSPAPDNESSVPDWHSISHDITCPMCDYNLRGLSEPVCPECGYRFAWPDVTDPTRRLHPYLFEHHPERNVRSFLQTLFHHLRPVRFWRTMNPAQPSRVKRIVIYWAICACSMLLPAAVTVLAWYTFVRNRYSFPRASHGMLWWVVHLHIRDPFFRGMFVELLAWAAYPWVSFLALLIFQQSMRRVRVKPSHVLRCALYAGDVILWNAVWTAGAVGLRILRGLPPARFERATLFLFLLGAIVAIAAYVIRLATAYRLYMQFDRAVATVLASQFIVALAMLAAIAYLPG